jgi:hypothetical protein
MGGWTEQIAPSAFEKTLKESRAIKALVNHNTDLVLASTKSGTLSLKTDDKGLFFELVAGSQDYATNLLESVTRGDIDACSFGFQVVKDQTVKQKDGTILRTILEVKLWEISMVCFPAYSDTSVALRDLFSTDEEYDDFTKQNIEERTEEVILETTKETTELEARAKQPEPKPKQADYLLVQSL